MAFLCDNCDKGVMMGRSQRHGRGVAGKRWSKRAPMTSKMFKPNVQKVGMLVDGKKVTMNFCTKCIKKFRKEGKIKSFAPVSLNA